MNINFSSGLEPTNNGLKRDVESQDIESKTSEELSPALKKIQQSYQQMRDARLEAQRKYDLLTPEKQKEQDIRTRIKLKRMSDIPLAPEEKRWLQDKSSTDL